MPRARRSGGNISAAAARESITIACDAPQNASPRKTSSPELDQQPSAVIAGPTTPNTNPPRITGIRPTRSEMRPAGPTASAPAIEEDRRAEAEDALEAGDRDERDRPERDRELHHPRQADEPGREHDRVAAKRAQPRPAAHESTASQAAPELGRAAVRGMADVDAAERLVRHAPDRHDAPAARQLAHERQARLDLGPGRAAVRALVAGVRRHDVPEQHVAVEVELARARRGRRSPSPRPGPRPSAAARR